MKQLKPPPHRLMTLQVNDSEARAFFQDGQIQEIRRHLTKRIASGPDRRIDEALEEISIACFRYAQAQKYHLPGDKVDIDWYDRIQEVAANFGDLIENGNPRTVNRLLIAVAEEAEYRPGGQSSTAGDDTDDDHRAQLSRQLERGLAILNQQMKLLLWWQSAAERAGEALPAGSGAPISTTPLLERSLIHELADIWCNYHNEEYVAPKVRLSPKDNNVRPNQYGGLFVEVVLKEARFDFSRLDIVGLGTKVRKERIQEWTKREEDPDYAATRTLREAGNQLRKRSLARKHIDPIEES